MESLASGHFCLGFTYTPDAVISASTRFLNFLKALGFLIFSSNFFLPVSVDSCPSFKKFSGNSSYLLIMMACQWLNWQAVQDI